MSPYNWARENINEFFSIPNLDAEFAASKLLLGLPFYGFAIDLKSGEKFHITGKQFLNYLKDNPEIEWNASTKECEIKHVHDSDHDRRLSIFYPCLKFLKERLALAEELEVGAFVWEGGQALEYFYQLL